MHIVLQARKWRLLLLCICLVLLSVGTPFLAWGLFSEGQYIGLLFSGAMMILILPELYLKLLLTPVSAVLKEHQIVVKYFHGTTRRVLLNQIEGYSLTDEQTRYGPKTGVLLHLQNAKSIAFTEINTKDLSPLITYLNNAKVNCNGAQKVKPWFLRGK